MKRLLLLMAIFMATATGVFAKGGLTVAQRLGNQDTIVVKMANGAKMILQLKNKEQLKAFENYSLDSLMRVLNVYVQRVDTMQAGSMDSKEMTVTFDAKEGGEGQAEQVTITMQETGNQTGKGKKEKHEIRINKTFRIDVEVEEDGDNTSVSVNVPDKAERDSTRAAEKEKSYKATNFTFGGVDVGLNTFLNTENGAIVPDLQPMGSRYISLNMGLNSQIGGRKSPFYLVSGLEFAFNNYMFDDNYVIQDFDNHTSFIKSERSLDKSKLTHSSINIPLMAQLQFKRDNGKDGFIIGAGGFAGYGLGSHAKLKYKEDGKTQKDKIRDSYNLSDFQYGLKGMIGYGSLNLFVKYNMNDLFKENRGPQANVLSFGFTFLN